MNLDDIMFREGGDGGEEENECANCGALDEFYVNPNGSTICGVCHSQSQVTAQVEQMDYDEMQATGFGNFRNIRVHWRGLAYNKTARVSVHDYNKSVAPPSLEACLKGLQFVLRNAAKQTAEVAGLQNNDNDTMAKDFLRVVGDIWFGYLEMWRLAADFYREMFPDLRLRMRDFFFKQPELLLLDRTLEEAREKTKSAPAEGENAAGDGVLAGATKEEQDKGGKKSGSEVKKKGGGRADPSKKRKRVSFGGTQSQSQTQSTSFFDGFDNSGSEDEDETDHPANPSDTVPSTSDVDSAAPPGVLKTEGHTYGANTKDTSASNDTDTTTINRMKGYKTLFETQAVEALGKAQTQAFKVSNPCLKASRNRTIRLTVIPYVEQLITQHNREKNQHTNKKKKSDKVGDQDDDAKKSDSHNDGEEENQTADNIDTTQQQEEMIDKAKAYCYVLLLQPSLQFCMTCLFTALLECRAGVTSAMFLQWIATGKIQLLNTYARLPKHLQSSLVHMQHCFTLWAFPSVESLEFDTALLQEIVKYHRRVGGIHINRSKEEGSVSSSGNSNTEMNIDRQNDNAMSPNNHQTAAASSSLAISKNATLTSIAKSLCLVVTTEKKESPINAPLMAARLVSRLGLPQQVLLYAYGLMGVEVDAEVVASTKQEENANADSDDDTAMREWLPPPLARAQVADLTQREEVIAVVLVACKLCKEMDLSSSSSWSVHNTALLQPPSKKLPPDSSAAAGTSATTTANTAAAPSAIPYTEQQMRYIGNGPTLDHYLSFLQEGPFHGLAIEKSFEPAMNWVQREIKASQSSDSAEAASINEEEAPRDDATLSSQQRVFPHTAIAGLSYPWVTTASKRNDENHTDYKAERQRKSSARSGAGGSSEEVGEGTQADEEDLLLMDSSSKRSDASVATGSSHHKNNPPPQQQQGQGVYIAYFSEGDEHKNRPKHPKYTLLNEYICRSEYVMPSETDRLVEELERELIAHFTSTEQLENGNDVVFHNCNQVE
jgi:hypothetical protein